MSEEDGSRDTSSARRKKGEKVDEAQLEDQKEKVIPDLRAVLDRVEESERSVQRSALRVERGGGFKPMPGVIPPPRGVVFICPEADYEWVRRTVGEKVPLCPNHKLALRRK